MKTSNNTLQRLLIICVIFAYAASLLPKRVLRHRVFSALRASIKPITYQPVSVPSLDNQLLVRSGAQDVLDTLNSWAASDSVEMDKVEEWISNGKAFWSTPQGTRAMIRSETQAARRGESFSDQSDDEESNFSFRRNRMPLAVNFFVNQGSDEYVLALCDRCLLLHF